MRIMTEVNGGIKNMKFILVSQMKHQFEQHEHELNIPQ